MDTSPLPSRGRPGGTRSTASPWNGRNPFSLAKEASFSRKNAGMTQSAESSQQSQAQKTQKTQKTQQTQKTQPTQLLSRPLQKLPRDDDDDIEDSDKEEEEDLDELARVGGFTDSLFFTQPTQVATQPTQILPRQPAGPPKASVLASAENPIALSSSPPRSNIEVPASSPFQSPRLPPSTTSTAAGSSGRLASLMAPAGTSYKSPIETARQLKEQQQQQKQKQQQTKPPSLRANAGARAVEKRNSNDGGDGEDGDDGDSFLDDIVCIEDSSDEGDGHRTARGDIRPSSFQRPVSALPPQAAGTAPSARTNGNVKVPNDRKMTHLIVKLQSQLRSKGYTNASVDACRNVLLQHDYSVQEAMKELLNKHIFAPSSSPPPVPANKKVPDMIRSFAYQANGDASKGRGVAANEAGPDRSIFSSSPASSQQSDNTRKRARSPSPRPKRRRLVQGRKQRTFSSSQPDTPVQQPRTRLVDLTGDNDMDEESEEAEMSAEDDNDNGGSGGDDDDDDVIEIDDDGDDLVNDSPAIEKRVLEYFNTCTVDDLVAMLGAKAKGKAETILSQRPFHSRAAVTRIRNTASAGSRGKKANANIGEDIFDAVEEYVVALQAIDVVVSQCEQKGLQIRSTLHRWNVDFRGSSKTRDTAGARSGSEPLTPVSEFGSSADRAGNSGHGGSYAPLPIPQEPELMRGHCTMKGYQLFGLNWLWELYQRNFGCILADDMGLGKTCQVISFLSQVIGDYAVRKGRDVDEVDEVDDADGERPWPNLVIVPPSTLANWKAEFRRFAPGIRVTTYSGSVAEREQLYYEIQEDRSQHHVVLTSYSQLSGKQDLDAMRKMAPNVAIFDEGHKMKNANTALYKSLKRINANWRLILTGTPVQNNLMEMINLLNFIQPTLFERHLEKLGALFSQRFTLQDVSNGALLFSDRVRRARSILEPFILQRRKEQVLASMPAKTTRVVYCELDATQRPIYETYERQFRAGKEKTTGTSGGAAAPAKKTRSAVTGLSNDQNNVWIQLRKSAIHAQLFRRYYDDKKVDKMARILMAEVPQAELRQPDLNHLVNELRDCSDFELHTWCRDYRCLSKYDMPEGLFLKSGKVQELLKLVRQCRAQGDRALVFTRFARVLNILRECLALSGIDYVSLEGATRVEERQAIIDEFNSNADITVFLLTTGSGGTGINLTAANKVIIFDQSDNPQDDVQAENRAHRLGQTREVEVIKLVTRGTIEELVYKACQTKLELAERVTASSSNSVVSGSGSSSSALPAAVDLLDGDKMAKAVEADVRKMLLAKDGATPPESDVGDE